MRTDDIYTWLFALGDEISVFNGTPQDAQDMFRRVMDGDVKSSETLTMYVEHGTHRYKVVQRQTKLKPKTRRKK